MATDTAHFTPADCLPCLTCGCHPVAWRAKGMWHLACVQIHPHVDVVNPGPDLGVLVRAWNRLNCPGIPDSSSAKGGK